MATEDSYRPSWNSLQSDLSEQLAPEFEIVRKIGGGGSTAVFLAREPALGRLVAVKVLRPPLAGADKARARFTREARSIARISHPNVVSLYRIGSVHGRLPYLVIQYVRGDSLAERLKNVGALPLDEGRRVLRSISAALGAAHARGILHRDLNPSHVLIEEGTGQTYLTDFGLALLFEEADGTGGRLTTEGHVVGNLRYLSPEQMEGQEADEKADIWGLGVLAWETLTGQGPFDADSLSATLRAGLESDAPSLAGLVPGLTEGEDQVLRRSLDRRPDRRPSAAEVARALESFSGSGRAWGGTGPADTDRGAGHGQRFRAQPAIAPLLLRTLGGLDLESSTGRDVERLLRQPKRMALLVYLAKAGESGRLRRDSIVGRLWPEADEARGRHALRQSLYVIRRVLGAGLFAETGDAEVELRTDALTCDVCEFERLARAGEAESAMLWYRGDFLPGFFLSDALEFERWMETERLRLKRLASDCCWKVADEKAYAGAHAEAGGWARQAAELTPFDEGAVHRLIVLLDALGDRAGALRAYDHFARRLLDEYAAEPSPETTALIARVRGRD